MGVFGTHAADYLAHDIAVFPCGRETGKQALVRNYQRMGLPASRKLSTSPRFGDANIGFLCGQRNRITVLDVDTPDRTAFDRALKECGDTPVKIQTGSGKFQAWYRWNGERRRIRPIDGEAIDILGGGVCIAPPSIRPDLDGKKYRFLEGSLDDIDHLPTIREGALPGEIYAHESRGPSHGKIDQGQRTNALFLELRKIALQCETLEELAFKAAGINEAIMNPPLSEARVMGQVRGVWKLVEEGNLIVPGSGAVVLGREEGARLYAYPPALALWHFLKSRHGPEHEFAICPTGLTKVLPYSVPTITKARDHLTAANFVKQTFWGGENGKSHLFRFSPKERGKGVCSIV